jgi:hypothetical protein
MSDIGKVGFSEVHVPRGAGVGAGDGTADWLRG